MELKFIECDTCRAKPGMPILCNGCLNNRLVIERLSEKYMKPKTKKPIGKLCACGDPSKPYDHHSSYCCCATRHFKAQVTCLSIDCPERKSVCCGAIPRAVSGNEGTGYYACTECGKEFIGGECAGEKKVEDWWEEHNWRKDFGSMLPNTPAAVIRENIIWYSGNSDKDHGDLVLAEEAIISNIEEFIETLLIKILAKCETAADARECRHIIKDYILKHG